MIAFAIALIAVVLTPNPDFANAVTTPRWPDGTIELRLENLEGLMLLSATIRGAHGRDTTGLLGLDTGAGFLAIDRDLARWAGIADSIGDTGPVGLAMHPLARLTLGALELDQVTPVMTMDGEIVRAVTDRAVFGLLGQRPLADRVVWIDAEYDRLALVPVETESDLPTAHDSGTERDSGSAGDRGTASSSGTVHDPGYEAGVDARLRASSSTLMGRLGPHARGLGFRIAGDGKIMLRARVGNFATSAKSAGGPTSAGPTSGPLTLILDTGATKCVLFQPSLAERWPGFRRWKTLSGLTAPTLIGVSQASIALVPEFALEVSHGGLKVQDLDVALLESDLADQLSRAVGERVDGLLGASFLWRFRVAIDYPHRVLWLDPIPDWKNPRPFEYCHPGLQLERHQGALRIVALVKGSPAERGGIRVGDELLEIDGVAAERFDLSAANRKLEGPPGTMCSISVRRGGSVVRLRLTRRRLL